MKITVKIPHVSWRGGRPRFNPGPKLRKLGFKGEDLRHADGRWLDLRETEDWVKARTAEIAARREDAKAKGRKKAAAAGAPAPRPGAYTIEDMFEDLYRSKSAFLAKSAKTQADYKSKAKSFAKVDPLLYAVPANELTRPAVVGLHEKIWEAKGLAMANGMLAVLRLAFSEAILRGKGRIIANPCLKLKLKQPEPRLRCGSPKEMAALIAAADAIEPAIGDAIVIALFTGQRRGDILALEDGQIEGGRVRLRQSKTRACVSIRALPQLVARLAAIKARNAAGDSRPARVTTRIVADPRNGRQWPDRLFGTRYDAARALAVAGDESKGLAPCPSLADFNFQDLRDTAVTWLARAGCTIPEIASVTGHSEQTIHTILKHYLLLDETLNDQAMEKLRTWAEKEGVKV